MQLNFRQLGDPSNPHVVIIHGLFGSASNWQSIARRLQRDFCLWLVDLRNHGDSPHSDEMTYPAMAEDLVEFIEAHCQGKAALIGHSMGGKAAMVAAATYPQNVSALLVMDSAPISHGSGFTAYAEAMAALDLDALSSRAQADAALAPTVAVAGVRGFLLQNLRSEDNQWRWRINLPVIARSMDTVAGFPAVTGSFQGPVLFLRGAESDYVPLDITAQCAGLFPNAQMATIADAGHWLHAQKPVEVSDAIITFLTAEAGLVPPAG